MRLPISILIFCYLLVPEYLLACSCVGRSPEQQVDGSAYIFIARIIAAFESPNQDDGYPGEVVAEFELVENIKGDATLVTNLIGGYGGGDCGLPFVVGRTLLVFTGDTGLVSICNGTQYVLRGLDKYDEFIANINSYLESGDPFPVDETTEDELWENEGCSAE